MSLQRNAGRYFVWSLDAAGEVLEGWGPYSLLGNTKIHARIKAQKGEHDVSLTTDPKRPEFRVVRIYEKGTGKTLLRDGAQVQNPAGGTDIDELWVP